VPTPAASVYYRRRGSEAAFADSVTQHDWRRCFATVPFRCPINLDHYWWYRWYGLRLNGIAAVAAPNYAHPTVCEGIGYFHVPISYSAQCHLRELRWLSDAVWARGVLRTFLTHQKPDGSFHGRIWADHTDGTDFYHADWGGAVLALDQAQPDAGFRREAYSGLARYAAWLRRTRDADASGMIDVVDQFETGQEYMSRYQAVDPDADRSGWEQRIRLQGIDVTIYAYRLFRALEYLAPDAAAGAAGGSGGSCSRRAPRDDPALELFCDVNPKDGRRTGVKAAACFYPYATDLVDASHLAGLARHLFDPREFWTPFPVPSSSADDLAFSPDAEWKGKRHNCPWNGRVWPMTNSHVIDALAQVVRAHRPGWAPRLGHLLRRFVRMMTFDARPDRPNCFEHYHPVTGRASLYRGVDDYQHSWVNDLIVSHLLGVLPHGETGLTIHPLPLGVESARIERLSVAGHRVDVSIAGSRYRVRVDARAAGQGRVGEPVTVSLTCGASPCSPSAPPRTPPGSCSPRSRHVARTRLARRLARRVASIRCALGSPGDEPPRCRRGHHALGRARGRLLLTAAREPGLWRWALRRTARTTPPFVRGGTRPTSYGPRRLRSFGAFPHVRGLAAYGPHPLFERLGQGTYVWAPSEGERYGQATYVRGRRPGRGAVVACERSYIHVNADRIVAWEYALGQGGVLCIGAFVAPAAPDPLLVRQLRAVLANAIGGEGIPAHTRTAPAASWPEPGRTARVDPNLVLPDGPRFDGPLPGLDSPLHVESRALSDEPLTLAGRRILIVGGEQRGIREIWAHPYRLLQDLVVTIGGETPLVRDAQITPIVVQRHLVSRTRIVEEAVTTALEHAIALLDYRPGKIGRARVRWCRSRPAGAWTCGARGHTCGRGGPALSRGARRRDADRPTRPGCRVPRFCRPVDWRLQAADDGPALQCELRVALEAPLRLAVIGGISRAELDEGVATLGRRGAQGLSGQRQRHEAQVREHLVRLRSPDEALNRAFEWAKLRLDSCFVDTRSGRSLVAG
jgi:hypothetical protein